MDDPLAAHAIFGDPEVTRFMLAGPVPDLEQQREDLRHTVLRYEEDARFGAWAVERRADGLVVGNVVLRPLPGWPEIEIGWHLARAYWGRGYASEAARAVVRYGLTVLCLERIVAVINPLNARSAAVAAHLGMAYEGPIRAFDQDLDLYATGPPTAQA